MSFTFDETIPTDRDYCRMRLDDTDSADPRLSDEMLDAMLLKWGIGGTLVEACNRIKLFYGKKTDSVGLAGGNRFSWKDRYKAYSELYQELSREFGLTATGQIIPGIGSGGLDFSAEDKIAYLPYQTIDDCEIGVLP